MNQVEAAQVVSVLTAGFQGAGERFNEANMAVWYDGMRDLGVGPSLKAASEWVRTQPRFPTVAEFRDLSRSIRKRELAAEKPVAELGVSYLSREENLKRAAELKKQLAKIEEAHRS